MDGLAEDYAGVMADSDRAQSRNQVAADRGGSRVIDLDSDRTDLLRVASHAVCRRADVVALDDRAIGIDDADLRPAGEALLAVGAGARDEIALGGGRSADAVVARETPY